MISLGSSSLSVNLQEQKAFQREREREWESERLGPAPPFFLAVACLNWALLSLAPLLCQTGRESLAPLIWIFVTENLMKFGIMFSTLKVNCDLTGDQ